MKPLNNSNLEHSEFDGIARHTDQLIHQPDIISLISCIINIYRNNFDCEVSLWLSDSIGALIAGDIINGQLVSADYLIELITKARDQRILLNINPDDQSASNLSNVVEFPLEYSGELLAVVKLESHNQNGFNIHEIIRINFIAQVSSISLYIKKLQNDNVKQQLKFTQRDFVSQINKSITSILDLDHLLNSAVSLIHQNFDFTKINIYSNNHGEKNGLCRVSFTNNRIERDNNVHIDDDALPVAKVIRDKDIVIINDTSTGDWLNLLANDDQIKSELVIPLYNSEEILGALELCSGRKNRFSQSDIDDFKSLSEVISLAIRNANIFKMGQLNWMIAERINQIIANISVEASIEDISYRLLAGVSEFIPNDSSAIWIVDDASDNNGIGLFSSSFYLAAVRINNPPALDSSISIPEYLTSIKKDLLKISDSDVDIFSEFPWVEQVLNSRTVITGNLEKHQEPLGFIQGYPEKYSSLGIPLIVNDKTIGIIIICDQVTNRFTNDSQIVAEIISNYAAAAIDKTRLFVATHEQMWISTILLQITEASQSIRSLSDLFETIAGMVKNLLGIQSCAFYLMDQSEKILYPHSSFGFIDEQQSRLEEWNLHSGSVTAFDELVFAKIPVILSPHSLSEEILSLIFPDYDLDIDLLILFPMVAQDIVVGALLVDFSETKLRMDSPQKDWDELYTIIQGITNQTAVTIRNLQNNKSLEEEAYISVALLQVAQAIVSLNRLDEILSSIVRITPILVGVKRCIIYLWDKEKLSFRISENYGFNKSELLFVDDYFKANEFPFIDLICSERKISYCPLEIDRNPSSWSDISIADIKTIQENSIDDADNIGYSLDASDFNEKQHLLIGFPLTIIDDFLGVMLIEEENPIKENISSHIREKRIEIVHGITKQTAIAIKNDLLQNEVVKSERMERELQLARDIQRAFLPDRIPEIPGWDINAYWQPAREVGGDFYDILFLDNNHIGFVIADVADKGMPAALFMTLIRTLIRASARDNLSPATVLRQVNDLLLQDAKNGMFVTVFYAVFDIRSGIVIYANGGHNPPIVKRSGIDELMELTRTSMALGIFSDIDVEERQIQLSVGDLLLLYTDGVTEAFSKDERMFGTYRLCKLIKKSIDMDSNEILNMINEAIDAFVDGIPLQDDITVAVIRKTAN